MSVEIKNSFWFLYKKKKTRKGYKGPKTKKLCMCPFRQLREQCSVSLHDLPAIFLFLLLKTTDKNNTIVWFLLSGPRQSKSVFMVQTHPVEKGQKFNTMIMLLLDIFSTTVRYVICGQLLYLSVKQSSPKQNKKKCKTNQIWSLLFVKERDFANFELD